MELRHGVFVATCEEHSFNGAAKRYRIAQSALSDGSPI